MFHTLKRLILRQSIPLPFDTEKAVGHYLLTLPRCTNRVLIVGQHYQDKRFYYELTVDAASLAAWAIKHEKAVWCSFEPEQAARKALPLWLSGADLTDNLISTLPPEFNKIMSEYTEVFSQMAGAQMYCHECRQIIENITKKKTDLPPSGRLNVRWHSEWHCSKGHLLYQEEFGMGISRRSKEFTKLASDPMKSLTKPDF
jgi:hypothetical protein